MGNFTNTLDTEKGIRKHILSFETTATFAEDDLETLKSATEAASDKIAIDVSGRNSGGTLRADVKYGPVRGANLHDVHKFFKGAGVQAVLDGSKTELACTCASKGGRCEDTTTKY
jgi:hypothetical protein